MASGSQCEGVPSHSTDPVLDAFARCYDALLRYIEQRVGHAADAADIVQETYMHLRDSRRDEVVANPRAFVYRVATNLAIDYKRRRDYRSQLVIPGALTEEVPSGEPTLERQLADHERLAALLEAVNSLPDRCREVFVLSKLQHLDHDEIGRRLGISQTMIRRHMRKALLRCTERLGELE